VPKPIKTELDVAYGTKPKQKLDIYWPTGKKKHNTTIIFYHGGSWRSGSKSTYKFVGKRLARMGYTAVLANYRLYPEVVYPDFVKDSLKAIKWSSENLLPTKIILMGHSAGAFNGAVLSIDKQYRNKLRKFSVKGFIGIGGPYNFKPRPDLRAVFAYTQEHPYNLVAMVDKPDIPMLLIAGRLDWVVSYKNSLCLASQIRACNGKVVLRIFPLLEHFSVIAPLFSGLSWIAPVRKEIKKFVSNS
jgi:pimeloyl-ACP methyl ester carboxylesterase